MAYRYAAWCAAPVDCGTIGGAPPSRPITTRNQRGPIMPEKLTGDARASALARLEGWSEVPGRDAITKTFMFTNFKDAFGYMANAALLADQMDHHPEWSNVYNKVVITMSTHDAGGVTELDTRFAEAMNRLVAMGPSSGQD